MVGAASLLFSPGKSIFLFSPPLVISLLGFRALHREHPWLARALAGATLPWLALVSSLAFFGGDWTWGPRYLVPLLPAWALAAPFAWSATPARRAAFGALAAAGLAVQLLGLAVDANRYYIERGLHPMFWGYDPWHFFRAGGSQLLARPAEVADVFGRGVPATAKAFRAGDPALPYTYITEGPDNDERKDPAAWMERYQVFHLPRPWPLWLPAIPAERQPVDPRRAAALLAAMAVAGAALVTSGLARFRASTSTYQNPEIPDR
jgi:hypothetical protein